MAYDGFGRRVELVHGGQTTRFLFDGRTVRATLDETDALSTWRSTWDGFLLAEWDASTGLTREAVLNHLGSVESWYEPTAGLDAVLRASFGAGLLLPSDPEPGALAWHDEDPSGLVFMDARSLDPQIGQFLSEDPVTSFNR